MTRRAVLEKASRQATMNFDDIFAEYDNAPVQEKHPPPRVHLMRAMEAGGTPLPAMQAGSAAAAPRAMGMETARQTTG